MNFLRTPSIFVANNSKPKKEATRNKSSPSENRRDNRTERKRQEVRTIGYQSPIDLLHERLTNQIEQSDRELQEVMVCTDKLRADLQAVSQSAAAFAKTLGKFSEKTGSLVTSDLVDPEYKAIAHSEHFKHSMLMAALHQLGKYYLLMAEEHHNMAYTFLDDFQLIVKERQEKHRDKFTQWSVQYDQSIQSAMYEIEQTRRGIKQTSTGQEQNEVFDMITNLLGELDASKKSSLRALIKAERHHYVHFTHRLQLAFKSHIQSFRRLYYQELDNTPDLMDVSRIREILDKHDKPSQLYLRLRRPESEANGVLGTVDKDNRYSMAPNQLGLETNSPSNESASDFKHRPMSSYPELEASSGPGSAKTGDSEKEPNAAELNGVYLQKQGDESLGNEIMSKINDFGKDEDEEPPRQSKLFKDDKTSLQTKRQTILESMEASGLDKSTDASLDMVRGILTSRSIQSKQARVLYDYSGANESDLHVKKDDVIEVISTEGEWAYAIAENDVKGKRVVVMGWVPISYTSVSEELEN